MYSLEFMKFLIARDADNYINKESKTDKSKDNPIFRYAKLATVPIEVKEK